MWLTVFFSILVALVGLYLYSNSNGSVEGFTSSSGKPRCPDMLIQDNAKFYLYNSKLAKIPGVNPIQFDNLEDYTEFLDWQRSQGIRCPVLFLQKTLDAQGNAVFKVRPNVHEPQGGLNPVVSPSVLSSDTTTSQIAGDGIEYPPYDPAFIDSYLNQDPTLLIDATRNDPPYNKQSYPSYDPTSFYQGKETPLDKMDDKYKKPGAISPLATDPNWGGAEYTQDLINQGYFKANEVSIYVTD